jgi:hypothetical protein
MISSITFLVVLVCLIGLFHILIFRNENLKKLDFSDDYRIKLIEQANNYFSSSAIDKSALYWLTKKSEKIQNLVGRFGIMDYKPALQNEFYKNYHIIINTIPKFNLRTLHPDDITYVDNSISRFIGSLEEKHDVYSKKMKNPISWFREGLIQLTSLPIYVLNWFGILQDSSVNKLLFNIVYRTTMGIVGLVAFLSGLVTIIQGRKSLIDFIVDILKR